VAVGLWCREPIENPGTSRGRGHILRDMHVSVLGGAEVSLGGTPVDLGTRKQRALLAALALHRGRPVAVDTLVDLLWADRPPAGVAGTLQAYVAGLRRALEPERPARAPSQVLVTVSPGYALHLPEGALDVSRFEATVSATHQSLAPLAAVAAGPPPAISREDLDRDVADLDEVLALWRGTPFLELEDAPAAVAERVRLEELRLVALEDKATAGLALGNHATVAAELEALVSAYPLRERLWALRVLALARSGRQAEALAVFSQVRRLLADELGIEPGNELRQLQTAVLRQDTSLDYVPLDSVGDAVRPEPARVTGTRPSPRPADTGAAPGAGWPLVGREAELQTLASLLDVADSGIPAFAAIVGEPGMGKSRLAEELAALATTRGALVLVGRCSQDEGAPPLWPWASVLAGLDASLPVEPGTEDESTQFRAWDDICATLLAACRDRTVLVVLDDLHWADVSSLRVLGLLLETARRGRLTVVATWRDKPPPAGALAAVADGLARRHAARLALEGLDPEEVAEVVGAVAAAKPSPDQAASLQVRTDGNPFFLVEYARLVEHGEDLDLLLDEPHPPAAVHDVLKRRVDRLPTETVRLLRTASVMGRDFDLTTLCRATGLDEEEALDCLDAATESGLLVDAGGDRFRFAHALVRDTVHADLSPSRRTRTHRLVAEALEGLPGRESEVARHWFAAGPAHADRAWRAATRAAEQARIVYAYDEAQELLERAVDQLDHDPAASTLDEYDVLMLLATTLQLAAKWVDLRSVVHRMIELADWLGDVERLARAAVLPSTGALWQASAHGAVDEPTVAALRRALDALPPQDGELRCRALLSLASETYYGSTPREREALADEGLAMARRLDDPALRLLACQLAFVSTWRAGTAEARLILAEESMVLARRIGDEDALTTALTVRAVVAGELGDIETMEALAQQARDRAQQRRQLYPLIVLDTLMVPWHAMRGQWDEAQRLVESVTATSGRMALTQAEDAIAGALLSVGMWQGLYPELLDTLLVLQEQSNLLLTPVVAAFLVRLGRVEDARQYLADHPADLMVDDWFSLLPWSLTAEVALALGDPELGRTSYSLLAPYAGRVTAAGSGVSMGPVDGFLALAAAATGELGLAARHADDALRLCQAWRIPLAAQWLHDQRDRFGF
jgi:DNA-binding SARP family transcriptional activator